MGLGETLKACCNTVTQFEEFIPAGNNIGGARPPPPPPPSSQDIGGGGGGGGGGAVAPCSPSIPTPLLKFTWVGVGFGGKLQCKIIARGTASPVAF